MPSQQLWDLTAESWYDYQITSDERPSIAIVRAVSAVRDMQVEEMRPLHHVADPNAIDTLFHETNLSTIRVEFVFCSCQVCVTSDTIYVRDAFGQ